MVEVPSAAVVIDVLARDCDFFSVGTNDLVQYTLAADRGNPSVAHLAHALDPAVLRLLARIVRDASGVPVSMCGDMASDPIALPVVLGLGYRSLSVAPSSLPLVREIVSRIDTSRAKTLADAALDLDGVREVRAHIRAAFGAELGSVWEQVGPDDG
jgi:phosphoenolpyruvate-protein kinase (PTS system EI component)